jgi:hypothetical protein
MAWARGHKADWDFFAAAAGDDYESVLKIYRHCPELLRPTGSMP